MSIFSSFIYTFKRKKYLRSQLGRKYQEKKERKTRERERKRRGIRGKYELGNYNHQI